jgi:enoyl-CoA hydratase/carnithine racemase
MDRLVNVERRANATILTIINPPVNALTRPVADALLAAFRAADTERVVITGSGKMFVAGADIRELQRITNGEIPPDINYLNELLSEIESSDRFVVMAINGGALGIGLELAMAGHYRVLAAGSQLGLPEVKLGLIPGAGGTQRLPRLAGLDRALRMIVTGAVLKAAEALEAGIVDEVADGDVVERALLAPRGRRTCDLAIVGDCDWSQYPPLITPGQRAPMHAIGAIRAAATAKDFAAGLASEREIFTAVLLDPQARAMIHLFFAEREVARVPWLPADAAAASFESYADDVFHASGTCLMRLSPTGLVYEIRMTAETTPATLAAALAWVKAQRKLAVVTRAGEWLGREQFDPRRGLAAVEAGEVARASDLDVLLVRGYGYPEHEGGPMFAYSITPIQSSASLREPLK